MSVPGVLEKFFDPNQKEVVNSVRQTFAMMWGLEREDDETTAIIKVYFNQLFHSIIKSQGCDFKST